MDYGTSRIAGSRWFENSGAENLTAAFENDAISGADHTSHRTTRSSQIQIAACDRHRRQSLPTARLTKAAGTITTSSNWCLNISKALLFDAYYSGSGTDVNYCIAQRHHIRHNKQKHRP